MKSTIIASILAASTLLGLAGCATSDASDNTAPTAANLGKAPAVTGTYFQKMPNGTEVLCAWEEQGYSGGVTCDWTNATGNNKNIQDN